VQVIDVLCAEKKSSGQLRFQCSESAVRRVRLRMLGGSAARRVEIPHAGRVTLPGLWRAHIFNAMAFPETV
jgi:hypothetical protein